MDETQQASRRFVGAILRATGWSAYRLAKEAGVVHTTLTRFLNDTTVTHTLSGRTLSKLRLAAERVLRPEAIDDLWLQSQRAPPRRPASAPKEKRRA